MTRHPGNTLLTCCTVSPHGSPDRRSPQLATILLVHEKARARAWKEKNVRVLEFLLGPDFIEINVLGRFSKKDILTSLLPTLTVHEFIISDPQLVVASPDAAILVYRCIEDLTPLRYNGGSAGS